MGPLGAGLGGLWKNLGDVEAVNCFNGHFGAVTSVNAQEETQGPVLCILSTPSHSKYYKNNSNNKTSIY